MSRTHRVCRLAVLACAIGAFCAPASAGDPPADSLPHITALADDAFATRERAQQHLIELGEPIIPAVRGALETSQDPEQRQRLETILQRIAEESVIGATRIALDLDDAPIEDAILAINAQTTGGLLIYPRETWHGQSGPRVTIHAQRQPLWSVLREIASQVNVDLMPCEDGIRIGPGCGGGNAGVARAPGTVSGPALIAAGRIYHQRSIEFNQGSLRTDDFGIHFNAVLEPKVKVMPGVALVRITEAVDDRGNDLLPGQEVQETFGTPAAAYWAFVTRLRYPESAGTRLQKVVGEITFNAATRFQSIELTDLEGARNVTAEVKGLRFIVRSVTQTGDRYEVALAAITPDPNGGAGPFGNDGSSMHRLQQLLYTADLRLLDEAGRSILRSSGPNFTAAAEPGAIELVMTFDRNLSDGRPAPGAARRLVWRIPVESKPITLPFELRDLPMP